MYALVFLLTVIGVAYGQFASIQQPSSDLLTPFESPESPQHTNTRVQAAPAYPLRKVYQPVPITPRPITQYRPVVPNVPKSVVSVHRITGGGPEHAAQILRQEQDLSPDGNSYAYSFNTDNGIAAQEQGSLRQISKDETAMTASGSFQYTAPDGTPIAVSYVADENGFQPQGAHLPTPPPIPLAILRALEYIRTHPYVENKRRN